MALFSDELFDVFEEEPEKTSSKAKKRRRDVAGGSEQGRQTREEQKKPKVGETAPPVGAGSSLQPQLMEDEPFPEETDSKET